MAFFLLLCKDLNDHDRQSQLSAWNRSLPGPLSSSTIGNTNIAAASTSYRLQRPGPLMNDSLMAKVRFINVCVLCVCMHACVRARVHVYS